MKCKMSIYIEMKYMLLILKFEWYVHKNVYTKKKREKFKGRPFLSKPDK